MPRYLTPTSTAQILKYDPQDNESKDPQCSSLQPSFHCLLRITFSTDSLNWPEKVKWTNIFSCEGKKFSIISSEVAAEVCILCQKNHKKTGGCQYEGEATHTGNKKQHLKFGTALGNVYRLKKGIIKDRGCGGRGEGKEKMNERTVPFLPPLIAQIIINPKWIGRTVLRQTLNSRGDQTCVLKTGPCALEGMLCA